jgi:peptide deformylase
MAILPIVRLGRSVLREAAQPVDPARLGSPEIQTLIDDMIETMHDAGGVGLAAPQVDVPLQLFVYLATGADGEEQARVVVNAAVEPEKGDLLEDWEGCLSIPDLRGLVPRHFAVKVHAVDRHGERFSHRAEGYEARVIQHEFDHLNGIVFLDRMRDLRSLAFEDEWQEFVAEDDEAAAIG